MTVSAPPAPPSPPSTPAAAPAGWLESTALSPPVWLGLAGSAFLAVGEVRRRGVTGTWFDQLVSGRTPLTLIIVGILMLSAAWILLRPRGNPGPSVPAVLALWSLPLLLLPPVLSTDAGSYADLGWMLQHGYDPYAQGLGTTGSPFAYGRAWRGTTSVYPAGSLLLFGWVVTATGANATWSVIALRLLAVAGAALLLFGIPRLARLVGVDPARALWLAVLNPLTLVHGIGGEHVDLLMAGLLVAGLALSRGRFGLLAGAVVVGLAALVKQPALLAAPAVAGVWLLGRPVGRLRLLLASAGATAIAVAAFVGLSELSGLGLGWIGGSGTPTRSDTPTLAFLITDLVGPLVPQETLELAAAAVALAAVGYLFLRHLGPSPLRFLALSSVAWVFGFGALREWYLIFPLALLGLVAADRWLLAIVPMTVLFAGYGGFREYQRWGVADSFWAAAGLSLGLCLAWVAVEAWRRSRRPPPIGVT